MDIIYQNSSIFKEMAVLAHFGIIFKDVVPKYPFDAAVEFKATNQIILQIAMHIYIYSVSRSTIAGASCTRLSSSQYFFLCACVCVCVVLWDTFHIWFTENSIEILSTYRCIY